MNITLLSLFFQLQLLGTLENKPVVLCADPAVFHTSVLLSICQIETSNDFSFGLCWSEKSNPSIFDDFTIFNNEQSSFEFRVSDLNPNTIYHFRFFSLDKNGNTIYYSSFQIQTIRELQVGDYYQGGIICYIFAPSDSLFFVPWEQHGLIISKEDLGFAQWGMHGRPISDSTHTGLGFGKLNTEKILKQLGVASVTYYSPNASGLKIVYPCAALLCHEFVSDGYDDWFLPSKGEWEKLYLKLDFLSILALNPNLDYWSSSEVYFTWKFNKDRPRYTKYHHKRAWQVRLRSKELVVYTMASKKNSVLVRAMRYF